MKTQPNRHPLTGEKAVSVATAQAAHFTRQGQTEHTPGPWTYNSSGRVIASAGLVVICGGATSEANARLIASAPDLLAALEASLKWGITNTGIRARVRAAIANAKGGAL